MAIGRLFDMHCTTAFDMRKSRLENSHREHVAF